jgi:phosphate/sulfate permease
MLLEWVIGSPIVGLACAVIVFMVSNRLLRVAAAKDASNDRDPTPATAPGTHPAGQPASAGGLRRPI